MSASPSLTLPPLGTTPRKDLEMQVALVAPDIICKLLCVQSGRQLWPAAEGSPVHSGLCLTSSSLAFETKVACAHAPWNSLGPGGGTSARTGGGPLPANQQMDNRRLLTRRPCRLAIQVSLSLESIPSSPCREDPQISSPRGRSLLTTADPSPVELPPGQDLI